VSSDASGHGSPAAAPARAFSWRFTTPLFIGSALNPINSSLIATALVPIAHGVGVSVGQAATLVTALYLASAIGQPTAGKAAEVFGPRRVFLVGIALVAAGGLAGGIALGLGTLIASRVLVGLGTSCAYPTAMLLIRRRAAELGMDRPPGGVLGGLQISAIASASLGLPIGGLLVAAFGWRAIFFVNVPVAAAALVATVLWVERDPPSRCSRSLGEIASRLDLAGITGFSLAMLALLVFLFQLPTARWWLLALSIVLWTGEILWELHVRSPFVDVRLLVARPALAATYVRFGLVLLCLYTVLYGITQWVETVRDVGEAAAGLLILPMTLVSGAIIAPVSKRNLVRGPVGAATVACLAGSAVALRLDSGAWLGLVVILAIVFGAAMGFASAGNQTALYTLAPAEQLGTAAGLLRTFGYIGSIASAAITGIVFRHGVTDHGMHEIAWIMVGVSLALTALTLPVQTLRHR
jgi:MFS family permease